MSRAICRGTRRNSALARAAFSVAVLCTLHPPANAQGDSPLTPVPPRQVHRISTENRPEPAPLPPEQIVQAFAAREEECMKAHQNYSFKRSIRLEEFLPGGERGGALFQESTIYLADNGRRYEKKGDTATQGFAQANVASEDLKSVSQIPLFPLVPDQLRYYDFIYKGSQPLDELHTYIFEVKPKRLLAGYRLFQGLAYIDDRDLAIVQLYGRWEALPGEEGSEPDARRIPFSMYEIYYENVDGKLWFPTYIRSNAYLKSKSTEYELRLIIKMTDFKAAPAVPAPDAAGSAPAAGDSPKSAAPAPPPGKPPARVPPLPPI